MRERSAQCMCMTHLAATYDVVPRPPGLRTSACRMRVCKRELLCKEEQDRLKRMFLWEAHQDCAAACRPSFGDALCERKDATTQHTLWLFTTLCVGAVLPTNSLRLPCRRAQKKSESAMLPKCKAPRVQGRDLADSTSPCADVVQDSPAGFCANAPVKVKPLARRRASGLSKEVTKAASGAMAYRQQIRPP